MLYDLISNILVAFFKFYFILEFVANILALFAPVPNRNMETQLWRRKKEWLYYFAKGETQ